MGLTVLIVGCGDLGNQLGQQLHTAQHQVFGIRRNIAQLSPGIQPIALDLNAPEPYPELPRVDLVVYCAAPKIRDLVTYRSIYVEGPQRILNALPTPPERFILVGSTGVYAQSDGEWIDEHSVAEPNNPFGVLLLEGERALVQSPVPVTVARCSGIYGPSRMHLINRVRSGTGALHAPVHYSNRIHVEDAAGALCHLIAAEGAGESLKPLYLLTDDEPTPISEITDWLAEQLGVSINHREMIARGGSKRIRNRALSESGYQLRYRNYRHGFEQILRTIKST